MLKKMSSVRQSILLGLLGVFVLGHLACLVTSTEYWPFSQYPMYAKVFEPDQFSYGKLQSVLPDGREGEFAVQDVFWPFWDRALNESLRRHHSRNQTRAALKALLRWRNERYQTLNKPWTGIRVYRHYFNYERMVGLAASGELVRQIVGPDRRELLIEVGGE